MNTVQEYIKLDIDMVKVNENKPDNIKTGNINEL